jgi:hypothetical protein
VERQVSYVRGHNPCCTSSPQGTYQQRANRSAASDQHLFAKYAASPLNGMKTNR